jgi:hypothetical protein
MPIVSNLAAAVTALGLSFGSNGYSTLGPTYSDGTVQQALSRISDQVSAAYAASGTATIAKPADLFPSPRFVPGTGTTSWALAPVDATHVTFCMAKTVTSVADWAATMRGFSRASLSPAGNSTCTPAGGYNVPANFPSMVYAYKTLVRAAPASPLQNFKVSGLSTSGVGNVYGLPLFWGAPLALTIAPTSTLPGTYSVVSATASEGFGVQTTCSRVPGSMPCLVFIYYAALTFHPTSSGTATLTFSTGDKVSISLVGHLL